MFNLEISKKDGLEWISQLVLIVPIIVTILLVPAVNMILGRDWKILSHLSEIFSKVVGGRFLASLLFAILAAFDWYYVLLFWLIAMIYQNSIYSWFRFQKNW